jgi:hypothetical protein
MNNSNIMVISPIEVPETTSALKVFPVQYEFMKENKRMIRYLTDSYDLVEVEYGKEMPKRLRVSLIDANSYLHKFDISALTEKGQKDIYKWASEHPLLTDPSGFIENNNNKLGAATYEIMFLRQVAAKRYDDDTKITRAYMKFTLLPTETKRATAVFFGINPENMDDDILTNKVVGLTGGIITSNKVNLDKFLGDFNSLMDSISLNFRAAVLCGVIIDAEGNFLIAETSYVLGTEVNAISTLRTREDLRNIVYRGLREQGMLQQLGDFEESSANSMHETLAGKNEVVGEFQDLLTPNKEKEELKKAQEEAATAKAQNDALMKRLEALEDASKQPKEEAPKEEKPKAEAKADVKEEKPKATTTAK